MKIVRMMLVCLVVFGMAIAASASSNWLQKGTDALKSLDTGGAENSAAIGTNLPTSDVIAGLKEALAVGSEQVVQQLGQTDGFYNDPRIHIPLPEKLATVKSALDKVGMGSFAGDVELKLNRAAEAATPKARELFLNAISQMTFEDARGILNGPEDAATQYFKKPCLRIWPKP